METRETSMPQALFLGGICGFVAYTLFSLHTFIHYALATLFGFAFLFFMRTAYEMQFGDKKDD